MIEISLIMQAIYFPQHKAIPAISFTSPATTRPTTSTRQEVDSGVDVPPLYSKLKWREVNTGSNTSLYSDIKNNILYYKSEVLKLNIAGQEWTALEDKEGEFEKDYEQELIKNNWSSELPFNEDRLQTINAGGPIGGIWGYIKITGKKMRIIVLSMERTSPKTGKLTDICPCNHAYHIFISNVIPMTEIEKSI